MNVSLKACDEHYNLRRSSIDSPLQLSFQKNEKGVCCLVYTEDNSTKTYDGGIKDMQKEKKIVWVNPSENPIRCPM